MFSFRYHAISLVAVLIALAVGVLLGVAIGDAGLVSSAEQNLRADLRKDVDRAEDRASDLEAKLSEQRRDARNFERASYPLLVDGRLTRLRVGVLFLGSPSRETRDDIADAIDPSGARLVGTLSLREPVDTGALAGQAGETRYSQLDRDAGLLGDFGKRIGIQLLEGGKLLRNEARSLFSRRAGSVGPFDAVVVVRRPPEGLTDVQRKRADDLEDGLMRGLTSGTTAIVGVEPSASTPSQVPWYRDRDLPAVDNVDSVAGHAALVFALGGASGTFGTGPVAEGLLPAVESITR